MASKPSEQLIEWLTARSVAIPVNPRLLEKIAAADLIVYSPGTQHSSLFPSYLTRGLSRAIARNLSALKLLITNIQSDAEIVDTTAVEIIDKAVYYLQEKGQRTVPTPFLITHYLINDPRRAPEDAPYVPLGRLDSLEDPRLVRIGNYEDGVTGRHDPTKVLTPFLESLIARPRRRVAVWLHDSGSPNKTIQTLLEMVRAGIADVPLTVTAFTADGTVVDGGFRTCCRSTFAPSVEVLSRSRRCSHRCGAGIRLRRAVRVVGNVQRRGPGQPRRLSELGPPRRRLGQPPIVGHGHRHVGPPAIQAPGMAACGQPGRKSCSQRRLPTAVWTVCL